jgi:hypothetical protein
MGGDDLLGVGTYIEAAMTACAIALIAVTACVVMTACGDSAQRRPQKSAV